MSLKRFTQQQVDDAVVELKHCIEDAKRGGTFNDLLIHLPRLAYLLTHNNVLIHFLNCLPKPDMQSFWESVEMHWIGLEREFPIEPKARLSKQIAVLIAIGEEKISLWEYAGEMFRGEPSKFWAEIFFPATRDLLRHAISSQKNFHQWAKTNVGLNKQKMSVTKSYSLDLFISHSSKDKRVAKALIEFLRAALVIPPERVRCTSVDGYKLSAGAKTEASLRKEIQDARCFIGLITPDSLKSQFVLFELGARWGSNEHFVPLLARGLSASVLRAPLSGLNALNCASRSEMQQLVHDLSTFLKRKVPLPATYEAQLCSLLRVRRIEEKPHES